MIKILIVEDQSMVLGALSALVDLEADMQVVGTAINGIEALQYCESEDIDVVISDIEMPKMNGIELAQRLQETPHPAKVIMLTTFSRGGYVRRALDANVSAYLLKDAPASELAQSIRLVVSGGTVIAPELMRDAWQSGVNPLSAKEQQILIRILEGMSTGDIAEQLCLSAGTVRNYIHSSCQKLDAKNRIEVATRARAVGWL